MRTTAARLAVTTLVALVSRWMADAVAGITQRDSSATTEVDGLCEERNRTMRIGRVPGVKTEAT